MAPIIRLFGTHSVSSPSEVRYRLAIAYGIGLALIAALSTSVWFSTTILIDATDQIAVEVNVSGRQRMLSQRIAMLAVLPPPVAQTMDGRNRQDLILGCADLMERAHVALLSRDQEALEHTASEGISCRTGPPLALPRADLSPELHEAYFGGDPSLQTTMSQFLTLARTIAAQDANRVFNSGLSADQHQAFQIALQDLPEKLDALTRSIQIDGEDNIRLLSNIKTILWIITLSLLILELILIYIPISRMITGSFQKLQETIGSLEEHKQELTESMIRTQEADRAKSDFLANMSHELRTPLNAIIGFSQLLQVTDGSKFGKDRQMEYYKDIEGAAQHLLELVNDILDLAKVESGSSTIGYDPVDLQDIIRASLPLVEIDAVARSVSIHVEDSPPGSAVVLGDARMITQIVVNLLSNAVKYNVAGGQVRVSTERDEVTKKIELMVADTGIGIAAEDMDKVLQPFGRAVSEADIARTGIGLGLPLCKKLMELHSGELQIVSTEGVGTTIILVFHCPEPDEAPIAAMPGDTSPEGDAPPKVKDPQPA